MFPSKVATIVPLNHLHEIVDDYYLMALSHAASHKDYAKFFADRSKEGKYVILDNSAVEVGKPESFDTYLSKAVRMNVSQIMLPDYFKDVERTLYAAKEAIVPLQEMSRFNGRKFDIMVVPQGRSLEEWKKCAINLVLSVCRASNIVAKTITIGISCRYTTLFEGSRVGAALYIINLFGFSRPFIKVHLLGCYADPRYEVCNLLPLESIQGVDSSYPTVYTQNNIRLTPDMFANIRPPRNIDFLKDTYEEKLLQQNIKMWRKACQGTCL